MSYEESILAEASRLANCDRPEAPAAALVMATVAQAYILQDIGASL